MEPVEVVLGAWCNFIAIDGYLPGAVGKQYIKANTIVELYQVVVEQQLLVVRPTTGYWVGLALREWIANAADEYRRRSGLARLAKAEATRPLIWFELRSNDRIWLNQAEAIPAIVELLKLRFPSLAIVLAGWSRMEDYNDADELMVGRDWALARSIECKIPASVHVFNIVGCRTIEKLAWGLAADTFVATRERAWLFPT